MNKFELRLYSYYYKNLYNVSLISLIKIFGEKTMLIYNAVLRNQKVILIGYERSVKESISLACACAYLVYPLNVYKNLYPYEHLLDLDFVENESYIASVSNPIFNTRKEWFDLSCDISNGNVTKS